MRHLFPPSLGLAAALALPSLAPVEASAQSKSGAPDAAEQGATAGDEEGAASLTPGWEEAMLADRPVAAAEVRFRPGKGLEVRSADGDWSITTRLRGQILYALTVGPAGVDGGSAIAEALQVRRARLGFSGNAFGKHNKYRMELAVSSRDEFASAGGVGTTPLLDWYLTFDYLPAATLVVGQYRIPFSRQRLVSSGSLQLVDRSIIQGEFNLDRDIGFDVRASEPIAGLFRYSAGLYIGEGRNAFEERRPGLLYLVRAEVLPFGPFEDFVESDFERGPSPRLALAVSYAQQRNASRLQGNLGGAPRDGGTTDYHHVSSDAHFKLAGASVLAEAFLRQGTRNPGSATDDAGVPLPVELPRNGLGYFVQGGYLLPRTAFELSVRYGHLRPLGAAGSSLSERNEAGVGASYYFARHSLKLQADYFRLWEGAGVGEGANQVRLQLEAGL